MKLKGKKRYIIPVLFLGILGVGPRQSYPELESKIPEMDISLAELESYISEKEAKVANLKPNNEAQIIWADSIRKTPYSIVYLHGFSASPMEGAPVHEEVAQRYGCNLYLARLAGHGINDPESFAGLTPNDMVNSAREAIAIGKLLGEKVILMSCSTGGTLSIYLAAHNNEDVDALMMYSPNIALYSKLADILVWPWGRQIGKMMVGDYRNIEYPDEESPKYWTTQYSMDGVAALMGLINTTMKKETFESVTQPMFVGYYYKNEEEQDKVISVEAIRKFVDAAGTADEQRQIVAFPDAGAHVITSDLRCKDLDGVRRESFEFMEQILKIAPVTRDTFNGAD